MITYESNPSMKKYIDRITEAGKIVRSAKQEIYGISEEALMTTEKAAHHIETMIQWAFAGLSEKLSKRTSSDACAAIISTINLALNHPELINDIEHAIMGAMKRY